MTLFITLEIYRIPIPVIGYNITIYHIFLTVALFFGAISILLYKKGRLHINGEVRLVLGIFTLFAVYSFLGFLRNINTMVLESRSAFLVELIGYIIVFGLIIFISQWKSFKKIIAAFLISGIFVYLGSFYHLFMWIFEGEYVTGVPFWYEFSRSEQVKSYLESRSWFAAFPRFRLPFSSPAGTGIFLSLSGIILLAFTLQSFANKKKSRHRILLLNVINFICLLGTFARASWIVYVIGSIFVLWYFYRYKLIGFGKITRIYLVALVLFLIIISVISNGAEFTHAIVSRFNPELTYASNVGHLKSRILALHYWMENPIIGLGEGGFWLKHGGGIHTHSTYFTILVNRGLIGLILFLSFFFSFYLLLKKRILFNLKSENKIASIYGIALLGGLMGLFIGHLLYEMNSEVIWLYYGLIFSYINLRLTISENKN